MQALDVGILAELALGSRVAAERVLPLVFEKLKISSAIDVGCGSGEWLRVARKLGAQCVLGLDAKTPRDLSAGEFCAVDLTAPIVLPQKFDLCICLEVAEHLPRNRGISLVRDLIQLSDRILFSAAIPGQGGYGHVNEQWTEYWANEFFQRGYLPWTGLRDTIWDFHEVPWWYRQNTILFVKESAWKCYLPREEPAPCFRLSRIHPECYLSKIRLTGPEATRQLAEYYTLRAEPV